MPFGIIRNVLDQNDSIILEGKELSLIGFDSNSLRTLCVLGASAVNVLKVFFTAETQRSLRLRRDQTDPYGF